MKNIIIIALLSFAFYGCSKDNANEEKPEQANEIEFEQADISDFENISRSDDPENSIVGKWKLVIYRTSGFGGNRQTIDCSQDNIIYEFKTGGTLIISSDTDEPDGIVLEGEYSYKFEESSYNADISGDELDLIIHHTNYHPFMYSISNNLMILDLAPLDGDTYYFEKTDM